MEIRRVMRSYEINLVVVFSLKGAPHTIVFVLHLSRRWSLLR